jgi:hypothetical protein
MSDFPVLSRDVINQTLPDRGLRGVYTVKKKVREFPVPSRDVTTKLFLGGNNDVITELFVPRGSLVGDGKLVSLFLRCSDILAGDTLYSL